jgi:uncharacterized protein YaiL (DUF2058 family)
MSKTVLKKASKEPTVLELREILRQKGIKVSGNKPELLQRLKEIKKIEERNIKKKTCKKQVEKLVRQDSYDTSDSNEYFHLTIYNPKHLYGNFLNTITFRDLHKDLFKNTVSSLHAIAKSLRIKYYYKMNKAELIKQIKLKLKTTKHKLS